MSSQLERSSSSETLPRPGEEIQLVQSGDVPMPNQVQMNETQEGCQNIPPEDSQVQVAEEDIQDSCLDREENIQHYNLFGTNVAIQGEVSPFAMQLAAMLSLRMANRTFPSSGYGRGVSSTALGDEAHPGEDHNGAEQGEENGQQQTATPPKKKSKKAKAKASKTPDKK